MAYQELMLAGGLSTHAVQLVREVLDPYLRDVHAMLRLPIDGDEGLDAGCNFAAVNVLLAVVSGVSVTLFEPSYLTERGNRGQAFRDVLMRFYPWEEETDAPGVRKGEAEADDLWKLFRNPLVHALGVSDPQHRVAGRMIAVEKDPMTEEQIVQLEIELPRGTPWHTPTLTFVNDVLRLRVASLYWGVREMTERVIKTPQASSFQFPWTTANDPEDDTEE